MLDRRQVLRGLAVVAPTLIINRSSVPNAQNERTLDLKAFGMITDASRQEDVGAIAAENGRAFARAMAQIRALGGGTLIVPDGRILITARPDRHERQPSAAYALEIRDCRNVRLVSRNGKSVFVRLESDASAEAEIDASLAIINSASITVEGLQFEGQQTADVKSVTTGSNISLLFGSREIELRNLVLANGTNGIAIGDNRVVRNNRRIDVTQPVRGVSIEDVQIFNGEHAVLVNVAENVRINRLTHDVRPYSFAGRRQEDYIQRGIYLLSCRNVEIADSTLTNFHKTGLLMALYPRSRTYSDLERIRIRNLKLQGPSNRGRDHFIAIQIQDRATRPEDQRFARGIEMDGVSVSDARIGLNVRDDGVAEAAEPTVNGVSLRNFHLSATVTGVDVTCRRKVHKIHLEDGTAIGGCTEAPAGGRGIRLQPRIVAHSPHFRDITLRSVAAIGSRNGAVFRNVNNLTVSTSQFQAKRGHLSGASDVLFSDCTNVTVQSSRAVNGDLKLVNSPSAASGWSANTGSRPVNSALRRCEDR